MLRWINFGIGIPLLVALIAAGTQDSAPSTPVRVGVILATSGKADYIGKAERQVLEALQDGWKDAPVSQGRKIELIFVDSGTNPDKALTLYRQFAEDRSILAVIGPSTSPESIPVAIEAEHRSEDPPVLLSLAASRDIVVDAGKSSAGDMPRKWVFKFAQNDDLAANRLLGEMIRRGHRRVGLLYAKDPFGLSGARVFRDAVSRRGEVSLVHDVGFDSDLTRPEPVIAALPPSIDAVMIWGTKPGPQELVKELRRKGARVSIYLSHGNASGDFIRSAGVAADGVVLVGSRVLSPASTLKSDFPADKVILDFQNYWSSRFQGEPSHFAGHARDAYELLRKVLTNHPGIATRVELRNAIENLGPFDGVTGTFTFSREDHAGLTESAFETYEIANGRFVPVETKH